MPETKLRKISRETINNRAYAELRKAIMAARFSPGEKLTVRRIARDLGVSSMPVRAAFARLWAEKAIAQNSSGTMEIPRMTREQYTELLQLRSLLEGKAAEMAAGRITNGELSRLEKIATRLTEASLFGDANGYMAANQEFKFAVVAAARSEALADLVERLWLQVGPFMRFYINDIRRQHYLDRHEEVVEALRRRDGEAARLAIERDILDGADFLLEHSSNL